MKEHYYKTKIEWTGNQGDGTKNYKSYTRDHSIAIEGKYQEILASADSSFMGDESRYNPEDLFLSSLSACHMLWYLHLCSMHKIIVTDYVDNAMGIMEESKNGSGKFKEVILNPIVTVESSEMITKANEIHETANEMCFIANSCNFSVKHNPKAVVK
ncbi:OsmC family protein [Aquimarina longa]|uniref:OsmC family protein n=1 Tax=Aquimarina longa TaxID=1080221 RepID=UPI00078453D9|nr:OsmC family protein [Aquimarina longa]